LSLRKHLLDVNVLIALAEPEHIHHAAVIAWIDIPGLDWGLCSYTETGFLRITTNPKLGAHSAVESTKVLDALATRPGYRFWSNTASWTTLVAPFRHRVLGHQQITDALLLGLAIREEGILVTLDKGLKYLAGPAYNEHVLVLE